MNAKRTQQRTLPVLPLRDVVVFPYMVMPLFVGRAKSISALDEAMNEGKQLLLVSQKQADLEEPTVDDVFDVGTIANIIQLLKLPDGTVKVLVEGQQRAKINQLNDGEDHFSAEVTPIETTFGDEKELDVVKAAVLNEFGVHASINNISIGPSITKYELKLETGTRVNKIMSLQDDIKLALAAKDIRIEAPIPGKSLIGIEVPNKKVATISFKDIISSQKKDSSKPLEVPIGRDVSGSLITADLAKMPHLLIAGSTGSGKSVAINGIITSLLMNCPPDEVKLMLVDPKKVELGVYNGIPHLLTPVVTDPKKASRALHKLVSEMNYLLIRDNVIFLDIMR